MFSIAEADSTLLKDHFDLLLIDVSLPDGNGFDFCYRLSHDIRFQKVPKILLTGKDNTSDKVYGFNCGADDYITKPFNALELRARMDRFFRKSKSSEGSIFSHPGFIFNLEFQKCFVLEGKNEIDLGLSPTEFRLFLTLVKNEGRALSRRDIERLTWEAQGITIKMRGIDTHIAHLRKKLGPLKEVITSVYGQGYSFRMLPKKLGPLAA